MKYAITGHKGLIGTYLKKRLDKEGHKCVLNIDQREGFNVMDLMFKETELNEQVDEFYHFAAQCRINEAIANPILPHKNNADGILAVLEFCRKHKVPKIIAASTSRVLSPERNPYVASKIYLEEMIKSYHDCYDMDYIIVRPSTVYGPLFDETSRCINNFLTSALKGEEIKIYGNKDKTLDFTYIDDFVDGIMLARKGDWNKIYNISGKDEVKLSILALFIKNRVNNTIKINYYPEEKAQPQNVKIDTSEIEKLGYEPKVNISDGLDKMIKFYKTNPKAWKNYVDRGEKYYGV